MSAATLLRDGRSVDVRAATPADLEALASFLAAQPSLEARRIATTWAATTRQRTALVSPGTGCGTLLALPAGAPAPVVGFVHYTHRPDDESCEVVPVVDEAWQNLGLGSTLLEAAVREARALGIRHFHANMSGSNARMLGLLRDRMGEVYTRIVGGLTRVDFDVAD